MKKILKVLLTVLLFPLTVCAAEPFTVDVIFRPATVTAGEPVEITLISNRRNRMEYTLPELDGGRWLKNYISNSTQTSIVNGKASYSTRQTIPVMTEKPGALVIPSFTVRAGKESAVTRELVIRVHAVSDRPEAVRNTPGKLSGVISVPEKRSFFYVSEEIPLDLALLIPAGTEVRELSYPEMDPMENCVLADFSSVNPRSRFFTVPAESRRVIGNTEYIQLLFRTAFRALKPGKVIPGATLSAGVLYRSESRTRRGNSLFDDDFFDGFFASSARVVPTQVVFKYQGNGIEVRELPPVPEGMLFSGLTGNWKVSYALSSKSCRAGEPVELEVSFTGSGGRENLRPAPLELENFRIYPPQIKKLPDGIKVTYALIPLKPGEFKIDPCFAVFDPIKGIYTGTRANLLLASGRNEKAPAAPAAAVQDFSDSKPAAGPGNVPSPEKMLTDEIFYQKGSPGKAVKLPLIRNRILPITLMLIAGFAVFIILEMHRCRKIRSQEDAVFRKKHQLHSRGKEVIHLLEKQNFDAGAVREHALPLLAAVLNLDPGADGAEIAGKIKDPELAEWIASLDKAGFCPGAESSVQPISARGRKQLLKLLKKLAAVLIVCIAFDCSGAFNDAFDAGNNTLAEKEYQKYITPTSWSPGALYNLGSVYFRQGDLPRARLMFLRARLLMPADSETLENLNLVNRKLMQQEIGQSTTLTDVISHTCNQLRPDVYLLLAAAVLALVPVLAGLRSLLSRETLFWSAGILLLLFVLFSGIAAYQIRGPYSPENAVIIGKTVKLHTLPLENSRVEAVISGGGDARIVERRKEWSRAIVNGRDCWVKNSEIQSIFPGGVL